jgi:predicted NAD/FAD-dependent oxidoreductase
MAPPTARRIALVGAGIAGLACAARLQRAGRDVTIFDKGRRPGGRIATRRLDGAGFDHGAQFATARGPSLAAAIAAWERAGIVAPWPAASSDGATRWVGVPGMAAIPAHLAAQWARPPVQHRQVGVAWHAAEGWLLRHHAADTIAPGAILAEGGEVAGPFDAVLLAAPAPQTAALLAAIAHPFAERARAAAHAPCWAVMASFAGPLDLPDTRRVEAGPISWFAREASRPGRAPLPERFVIHASAAWSRDWLERDATEVHDALLAALPVTATPVAATAHRWRHALVERALETPCLWDADAGLGACGDWCLGGRVEAAWDSGEALAEAVLAGAVLAA